MIYRRLAGLLTKSWAPTSAIIDVLDPASMSPEVLHIEPGFYASLAIYVDF